MRVPLLISTLALCALSGAPAVADPGHHHGGASPHASAAGQPGDPRQPSRTVEIAMRDGGASMEFAPSALHIRRGEQVRFVVRNEGAADHELVLGTLKDNLAHGAAMAMHPDMAHHDGNALSLEPGNSGELVWKFTRPGVFDYSCLIPGHREAGMTGVITVE